MARNSHLWQAGLSTKRQPVHRRLFRGPARPSEVIIHHVDVVSEFSQMEPLRQMDEIYRSLITDKR